MRKRLEASARWPREQSYKHPWRALLSLSTGWLVALLLIEQRGEDRTYLLEVLTSVSTVAAATAAFWAANLARKAQEWQTSRENEEKRLEFYVAAVGKVYQTYVANGGQRDRFALNDAAENVHTVKIHRRITFANLSRYAVFISGIRYTSDLALSGLMDSEEHRRFISSDSAESIDLSISLTIQNSGNLEFFLQFGSSGQRYYKMTIPVEVRRFGKDSGFAADSSQYQVVLRYAEATIVPMDEPPYSVMEKELKLSHNGAPRAP